MERGEPKRHANHGGHCRGSRGVRSSGPCACLLADGAAPGADLVELELVELVELELVELVELVELELVELELTLVELVELVECTPGADGGEAASERCSAAEHLCHPRATPRHAS